MGANVGFVTLLFAHAGFRVVAVEAMAGNRKLLEASLCRLRQEKSTSAAARRVALVAAALGSPEAVAKIARPGGGVAGTASALAARRVHSGLRDGLGRAGSGLAARAAGAAHRVLHAV